MRYQAVVIGASTGGFEAIQNILIALPKNFGAPILIVQHISPHSDNFMARHLNDICKLTVKEADEKEKVRPGYVYIAPPNYHLLIEKNQTLSLTVEARVNYSRPSIDILFDTAADAYEKGLIGVLLTGANSDGSKGLKCIKEHGGTIIVQDPLSAEASAMPKAAIKITNVDYILTLEKIGDKLIKLIGDINEYK